MLMERIEVLQARLAMNLEERDQLAYMLDDANEKLERLTRPRDPKKVYTAAEISDIRRTAARCRWAKSERRNRPLTLS